jgi:carbamoyl-phosphate synthase small subunit
MGNVGTNALDEESVGPRVAGMIVREYSELSSNWRSTSTLGEWLARAGVPGLSGIDTRKLVRHLRTHGSKRGVLSSEAVTHAALVERARAVPDMEGQDLATPISSKKVYAFSAGLRDFAHPRAPQPPALHVVAYDYGLKASMLELLVDAGCRVTVVPASHSPEAVLALKPDGVFLTNGPGDPAAVVGAKERVAGLLGKVPVFGICLGHQLLALALGGKTFKMKFGHRGANHPVKDLATGKVEITSQNHGFAVDADSLVGKAEVTHLNLNDNTVEGLAAPELRAFSVQYHPEAGPGPHDARYLFGEFIDLMRAG